MDTSTYSLEWQDLSLWRGDRCLQQGLNGKLAGGKAIVLRGPNGCGKTTLLRTLCGLTQPEQGLVSWSGKPIERIRTDFNARLAYSGHNDGLKKDLSPRENLHFQALLRGRHTNQNDLLNGLNLKTCADLPVRNLSAGQRRRSALAMVLGSGRELWILDEPYTHLDKAGCNWLSKRFNDHLNMGGLLLMVVHGDSLINQEHEYVIEMSAPGGMQ
jgi:heme exporter protein A